MTQRMYHVLAYQCKKRGSHNHGESCCNINLTFVIWQADQKRKSHNHGDLQQQQLDLCGVTG